MKPFTSGKAIRRTVTIRSSDRSLPNTTWVLTFTERGLGVRRQSQRNTDTMWLSWRSIVGHALIHRGEIK